MMKIGSDTYKYTITYGPDLERCYTYYKKNGVIQYYTYYGVGYENCYHQETGTTVYTLRTYYVNTPDGLSGIVRYDSRTGTYTPYAVETDHLGSITALYNSSGTKVLAAGYDAWGRRTVTTGTLEFRRGYTGHEHIDGYDLINMNGRVYDPLIGRFLSPDMYVQLPGFSQSFNRYSYCLNNPLKYTDPDGESIIGAVVVGAIIGTYMGGVLSNEGEKNPFDWDYKSLDTWCYMACGLYVGAMSGAVGGYIASSGIPLANTASMMASSLVNSVGTWGYTGGTTDISINYGFGSYNFTKRENNRFLDGDNEWYEDLGYGLGAIGNVSDILRGFHNDEALLQTVKESKFDIFGHTQTTTLDDRVLTDFGPIKKIKCLLFRKGRNNWIDYNSDGQYIQVKDIPGNRLSPVVVKHLNMNNMQRYCNYLNNHTPRYNLFLNNCSMQAARALTLSGVPVLGFHPLLLHLQIAGGLRSYMFNYVYANGF